MTTEEKFHAAVNVIKSLPKNGSYQPSNHLLLKFYSYFKQATEGPCKQSKPPFWDLVRKAKYEAWKRLGNMSKEEAMLAYVDELKKIVDTMSYDENIENFLGGLNSVCESVPQHQLDLILGPVIERVKSQPGSPLSNSPLGGNSPKGVSPLLSRDVSPIRQTQIVKSINSNSTEKSKSLSNSKKSMAEISSTLKKLQLDLDRVLQRIKRLEMVSKLLSIQRGSENGGSSLVYYVNFVKNNLYVLIFIIFWPVFIQLIQTYLFYRR